jgi:UMF1 family MFS transporter
VEAPAAADRLNPRVVRAWCLYDFGNSAFAVLFPTAFAIYFKEQVVGDPRLGDLWWGRIVSCSMALVALTAPFLGGVADHAGVRRRMLFLYTLVGIGAVVGFATLQPGWIVLGFLLGTLADFAFEGGIAFYNAYLPAIAPPSHHGRVSAWGFATGYAGSLVALGVAAVLAPAASLKWVWIALALQWFLAALPAFRHLPPDRPGAMTFTAAAGEGFRRTVRTIREVARMKDLRWFLLSYFFYMDGVNTVIAFASLYASESLGFSDAQVFGMFAMVQVTALVGSLALARRTDTLGPRSVIRGLLVWWIGVVVGAYLARSQGVFFAVACLAGIGLGAIQAASRAYLSRLVPRGREAEMFGLYALCGKTGSILGPVVFGWVSWRMGDQRPAVLSVVVLYVIGLVLLSRVSVTPAAAEPSPTGPPSPPAA